jgi:hypothetical protein
MGRRGSDERSMASHACVAAHSHEEEVRYAAWDAVGEVIAYKPVKESAILWPALVSEREVRMSWKVPFRCLWRPGVFQPRVKILFDTVDFLQQLAACRVIESE